MDMKTLYEQITMYSEYLGYDHETDTETFSYIDSPIRARVRWNRVKHTIASITFYIGE